MNNEVVFLSDGDISICVDIESCVHLKCITRFGDPVELNAHELDELCEILKTMADRIR